MFRYLGTIAMAALLLLGSTPAHAAGPETEYEVQERLRQNHFARGGFYFGMEGLAAVENTDILGGSDRFVVSGGFEMRVGHRHNRWFSNEIMGLYVHTFAGDTQFLPPIGVLNGSFLAWGLYANQRVYFTKARFQPFLGAGLGFLQFISNERWAFLLTENGISIVPTPNSLGFSMVFSGGLEMYERESIAVTLQVNYHMQFGEVGDTDFITAGLGMQFF